MNHGGGRSFGRKAFDRFQLDHVDPDGLDDSPSADRGAERHREGTEQLYFYRDPVACLNHPAADQSQRDDAHGFLRIVAAVRVGHQSGGSDLQFGKPFVHGFLGSRAKQPVQEFHDKKTDHEANKRGGEERNNHLVQYRGPVNHTEFAGHDDRGADQASDERVGRTARQGNVPRDQIPYNCAAQSAGDHILSQMPDNQTGSNGFRHVDADEGADEIKRRRHHRRGPRAEDPCCDGGCNRICCVVEPIDKIENQREKDNSGKYDPRHIRRQSLSVFVQLLQLKSDSAIQTGYYIYIYY